MSDDRHFGVAGIVIRENEVLLVRQNYGPAANKLIVPGGYAKTDESPFVAVEREVLEEAGIVAAAQVIVSVRYRPGNWMLGIKMEYRSGTPKPDGQETNEACFSNIASALQDPQVSSFSKRMIEAANRDGLGMIPSDWVPSEHIGTDYVFYA